MTVISWINTVSDVFYAVQFEKLIILGATAPTANAREAFNLLDRDDIWVSHIVRIELTGRFEGQRCFVSER